MLAVPVPGTLFCYNGCHSGCAGGHLIDTRRQGFFGRMSSTVSSELPDDTGLHVEENVPNVERRT